MGDADFCNTFDEIAAVKPIIGAPVRPYSDCVEYVGYCSWATSAFDQDSDPHCLGMVIHKDGGARISTASATYVRRISDIMDTLADAVDKPIISKYGAARKESYGDSHRPEEEIASPIPKTKDGAKSPAIAS